MTDLLPIKSSHYWFLGIASFLMVFPLSIIITAFVQNNVKEVPMIQPDNLPMANHVQVDNEEMDVNDSLDQPAIEAENKTLKARINQFEFIRPVNDNLCQTNNPWLLGEKVIENGDSLSGQSCFAIKASFHETSNIMLISKDISGELTKIIPNSCSSYASMSVVETDEIIGIPKLMNGTMIVFSVDESPGEEIFFLLASSKNITLNNLHPSFNNIADICADQGIIIDDFNLSHELDALKTKNPANFDWQSFKFYH